MKPPTVYEESAPFSRDDWERLKAMHDKYRFLGALGVAYLKGKDNDGSWLRRREPK